MDNTVPIDFDLNSLTKEQLITFILFAHENNITFNEAFVKALESFIDTYQVKTE